MTAQVTHIWRHPIKAHGRERLQSVDLVENDTMPWDRAWAVVRDGSGVDGAAWTACGHFSRAARNPALQAIEARLDDATGDITVSHPDRPSLTFNPEKNPDRFISWAAGLGPQDAPGPARLVRSRERGMTDTPFPSLSLLNAASHRAVAQKLGQDIAPTRWRGNFLIDGLSPWEEFEWIGRRLRIGTAVLTVRERIGRCQATSANVTTGQRDTDMLRVLDGGWGHTDFGVYATVDTGGRVKPGDCVELLS